MERFDFSFNNKYVRWWFIIVLPLIIVSAVINFVVPAEHQRIFSYFPLLSVMIFFGWVKLDKRKNKHKTLENQKS